ncbi:hypothetical protein VET10_17770 [Escherichia coli]|nr:hypothetical protein VET10_17770 [Escherichia coli]
MILLGVGLGNAVDVIGMGAHNLFLTFLIETGMIGLFLFLVLLCIMCIYLKEDAIVIVLPFLIASMSLGTTAIPYFLPLLGYVFFLKENYLMSFDIVKETT